MSSRQQTTSAGRPLGDVASWVGELRRSARPLHAQIARAIAAAIEGGRIVPGERLPPERELAGWFGVNRLTLRQALADLEQRRLIRRTVGRRGGTFVAEPPLERDLSSFAGFSEQARRLGLTAGAVVLAARRLAASEAVAAALELPAGAEVQEIRRLRLANGRPVLLERSSFPAGRFPGMLEQPLGGSLYELLAGCYGVRPCRAVESLEPVQADKESARLLEVPSGAPLLGVERVAFDRLGRPVEHARDLFRGDRTRMVVWSFELPES